MIIPALFPFIGPILGGLSSWSLPPSILASAAFESGVPPAFPVIAVTGSSGKSSTVAMIDAALRAAGRRVVSYYDWTWREDGEPRFPPLASGSFRVSGQPTPSGSRPSAWWRCALSQVPPCDVAVIELSVTGPSDRRRTLDFAPALGIITNVGPDHLDVAGPMVADVARHKARIFWQTPLVVLGPVASELREVIVREVPALLDAPIGHHSTPLHGMHQQINAGIAAAAVAQVGISAPDFTDTRLNGRCDHVADGVVVDLVKNATGARAFAEYLAAINFRAPVTLTDSYGASLPGILGALAGVAQGFRMFAPEEEQRLLWSPHLPLVSAFDPAATFVPRVTPAAAVVGKFAPSMLAA